MASQNALVTAEEISVIRQGKAVLNAVSLSVEPRDFMTVIGPNGAGKSMLLKCLMGIVTPDSGRIRRKEGLKVGYMPQRLTPDPSLPICTRRFLSLRRKDSPEAIAEVAEETGLAAALDLPLHTLSGGQLQRALLARSLLGEPELLVLDEPAQNLDISGQLAFYRLLERIYAQRGVAILMVSHDLHMVMASTRQVLCLYHHVCCHGEPHAVTRDPEFVSLFGDDMARMMAVYQHSHNHGHAHDGAAHGEHCHD